jgi:D-alanine-D-alanine ligase
MAAGTRGFVPVLHAATLERPDEIDTLVAAQAVADALAALGFATEVVGLDLDLRGLEVLPRRRPLTVFNLVDAVRGDGRLAPMIPAVLDGLSLPYTGARTSAWLATLSKLATKLKLAASGLPTPEWSEDGHGLDAAAKVIVKPVFEHGSLGMDVGSVVKGADAAQAIKERALRWRTEHFAETYVEGREFNLALIEGDGAVAVLPIAEMLFEGFALGEPRIVGYDAKWAPDSATYIGTPRLFGLEADEPQLAAKLAELARAAWSCFDLTGYARVDFRVDRDGAPFILEVNVNPCLSPDAGFAAAAAQSGLIYGAVVGRIVQASLGDLQAIA